MISGKNINDVIHKLNEELKKICTWFRSNEMSLNPDKTKFMIFNAQENSIKWNEIDIWLDFNNLDQNNCENKIRLNYINSNSSTPAIKFLGVYIDPLLNFKHHISYVQKKIKTSLYTLNCVKNILPLESLKILYFSFIHSHLTYCLPAWSSGTESSLISLFKTQKNVLD